VGGKIGNIWSINLKFQSIDLKTFMSTKRSQDKKMVAPNNNEEEDDLSVLIDRESQLRKAEAAAAFEDITCICFIIRANHRCLVNNAKVLRNEESKSLRWRKIGPKKRWQKRSTDMNALLMDVEIRFSKEECA
jgi:hypothetical protein